MGSAGKVTDVTTLESGGELNGILNYVQSVFPLVSHIEALYSPAPGNGFMKCVCVRDCHVSTCVCGCVCATVYLSTLNVFVVMYTSICVCVCVGVGGCHCRDLNQRLNR